LPFYDAPGIIKNKIHYFKEGSEKDPFNCVNLNRKRDILNILKFEYPDLWVSFI